MDLAGARGLKASHGGGGVTAVFLCREEIEKAGTRRWLSPSYGENFPEEETFLNVVKNFSKRKPGGTLELM